MKTQLKSWAVAITALTTVFACTETIDNQITPPSSASSERVSATCGAQGWASQNGGTLGGGTAAATVVTTYAALKSAVQNSAVKVIQVNGTITVPAGGRISFQDQSAKTIFGTSGAKIVSADQTKDGSGILSIKRVNNLLIRNLIFEGPGAYDVDGWDLAVIDACKNVWVDHCEFRDGVDGNLDIKNTSDFVTVSWTKFNYLKPPRAGGPGGANDHRFSNLIGSSDGATADRGTLRVTFASCWWGPGCVERMPRVRFGRVHIINSLFDSSNASKCIMAGVEANILAENDVFENAKDAIYLIGGQTALQVKNCTFTNVTGNRTGTGTAFTPPYTVSPRSASAVKSSVTGATGAGAKISGNVCTSSAI